MKKLSLAPLFACTAGLLVATACGDISSPSRVLMAEIAHSDVIPVQTTGTNKTGFIDKSGNYVIEPNLSFATFFLDGMALASDSTSMGGYIDKKANG